MANSKLSKKDYSTINIKSIVTKSGRKSTQFNISFTEKTNAKKRTPVLKTSKAEERKIIAPAKTPQSKKDSENKKNAGQNKKNLSQNSSISDLEISDIINSSNGIEERDLFKNKKVEKPAPRCRKHIDYTEMFRGSSIINEKIPVVLLNKLPDQEKKVMSSNKTEPVVKLDKLSVEQIKNSSKTQPVVRLQRLSPEKMMDVTKKRHKVYSSIHNYQENIRPSQVYEFNYDPKCESKLTKQLKKEAKVLKKKIKAKVVLRHAAKICENTKKHQAIPKQVKNKLNVLPEISENDSSTNNTTNNQLIENPSKSFEVPHVQTKKKEIENIDSSTKNTINNQLIEKPSKSFEVSHVQTKKNEIENIDSSANNTINNQLIEKPSKSFEVCHVQTKKKEIKNILNESPEIFKENDLSENKENSVPKNAPVQKLDNSIAHKSFDKARISDSFRNSFKVPQSTPNQKGVNNNFKSPEMFKENANLPKNAPIQQTIHDSTIHISLDKNRISESFVNSFKATHTTSVPKSIHMNDQNQSNLEISQIENDFNDIEDISIQSNRTDITNQSIPWRVEIPRIRKEKFFQIKNSSLPSYNQDVIIKPQDVENLSNFSKSNCLNSEKKTKQSSILSFTQSLNSVKSKTNRKDSSDPSKDLTNSFESSLSDISIEDNSKNVAIDRFKNKRINFMNAITSSPSVKKNILGENNCSSKVQNISKNKSNVKSPVHKILGENNSLPKVQNVTNKDVYDENNKENFYHGNNVNIVNNCVVECEKSNSSCDFFGFNSFEQAEARKSKKPMRYPSILPVIKSKAKKILEPLAVQEENVDITNEHIDEEPIDISNENQVNVDADFQLFDEPRFSNYVRRSYAPATKRKRNQIQTIALTDQEDEIEIHPEVKKRKRNKKTKKEEEEFRKWAKQFNSMCQEVENEELVID